MIIFLCGSAQEGILDTSIEWMAIDYRDLKNKYFSNCLGILLSRISQTEF